MPSPHLLTDLSTPTRITMDSLLADCGSSDGYAAAEARLVIRASMAELTVSDRFLAELRFFHGWTLLEVAQLDGRTELDLGRAFARILDLLRVRLGATAAPTTRSGIDRSSSDRPRSTPPGGPRPAFPARVTYDVPA